MNSILTPKNENDDGFEFLDLENNVTISLSESANFLNLYFANVGKRKEPVTNIYGDKVVIGESFELGNVHLDEIRK